ncbi:serine/threonine protein kinase [Salpingoeca rosetta]|uniref:Serine/threonine protein kinase n=1 Tax=Salpingoeca rosetta (strain ATCC 50818 / BSB-021) TaxID=946362 RepID=F2UQK1_SALR5|nr:serine/threonine protein kinase [Salpingoeca rosetta]EGD79906.1 serine/threonine protein kinase [Salpingoeca rosetta]|eukprot:XP_004988527.1 serine/threonine protein kinase [Salpingoeca rosetta]
MRRAMMAAMAMLLVMVVVTRVPSTRARSTTAHGDKKLCSDVHGTLDSMVRVLEVHDVPFFPKHGANNKGNDNNNNNHTTGNTMTRETTVLSSLVDLSPIHRMMAAFGCGDRNGDGRGELELLENGEHKAPPAPSGTRFTTYVEERVNVIRRNATANLPLQQEAQLQHRRERRNNDPDVRAGQCTLTSVVNGTCPGADNRGWLTITLSESDDVDNSTDTSTLQAISTFVVDLTVSGHVQEAPLRWIVNNGVWARCRSFSVLDVQFLTFQLSMLNPMARIDTIWIHDSVLLREVGTSWFALKHELVDLELDNNALTSVPDVSGIVTTLKTLSLHGNRIRRINNDTFTGLTLIQQLFLGENLISKIEAQAFDDLTQLQLLTLFANDISAIPSGLFHGLTSLTQLELQQNPITKLDPDMFAELTMLDHLNLEHTLLAQLPATLFRSTTRLTSLALGNNFITSLDETVFSGLSLLEELRIFDNRLTSLPPGLFKNLTALTSLSAGSNDLPALPDDLLQFNTRLSEFLCDNNHLTALPTALFAHNPELWLVSFANNAIRSIDNVLEAAQLSSLEFLNLQNNQLTKLQLPEGLSRLRELDLSDNPMKELPHVTHTPALDTLQLQNHEIKHMDLAPLLRLPNLEVLELDASHGTESLAVLKDTSFTSTARLSTLSLENVNISAVVPSFEHLPPLSLNVLHVGWPGASSDAIPISTVCKLLASSFRELRITHTDYQTIELCPDKTFDSLLLNDNKHLRSIIVHSPLQKLNVSNCTRLTSIDAPPIDTLDISNTNFPPTGALCTRWGRRVLFARNLDEKAFRSEQAIEPLTNCIQRVNVLDLSGNKWLSQLEEINRVTQRAVVLSDEEYWTADFVLLPNRPTPPILQLTDAPIDCAVQLSNQDLRPVRDMAILTPQIVFSFRCTCARGFKMASGGRCVVDDPKIAIAGIAAGSVIGGLFFGLFVAWLSRRYRGLTKRIDLQEQLLVERDEEVMALKKVWEIGFDELRMIKRVAAGAFGVVFKARWDTVTVAVKVLQQAVMAFDISMVLEFEKEVEFLQRTRHPHVVRFFGAGTDPNGSPFLVLEYVAMGSLKDLLGKDMGEVLREVEQGERRSEDNAGVTAEDEEELTLVSTGCDRRAETMTAWDLKLRLLRDVASGMAFIHSLDQMHRDLKSGNVLVSANLRAKITDFGSIRQCFTRDSNQQRTRLSSSSHNDDPQYSQQTGLQTMTSMTLTAGVGTPLYMAPEALTGDKYSFEADVFSFGVLMWEVATQRVPDLIEQEKGSGYRGPILATISNLMADGKRLKFDDSEQDAISEWFQSLTYKCMAQNPRERPSFGELKDHHFA